MIRKLSTLVTVGSVVASVEGIMNKTFKWYEKKYGKRNDDYSRPIIKGGVK